MASKKGPEKEGGHDSVVKTASAIVSSFPGQQQAMMNELKSFDSRFANLEIAKGESRDAPRLEHTLATAETSLKAYVQQTDSGESAYIWDKSRESVDCFLSAFASVMTVVADSQVSSSDGDCMNRAVTLLRQILCTLGTELTHWLANDGVSLPADQLALLADSGADAAVQLQLMPTEAVERVAEIVQWMVRGGGGKECCITYAAHRKRVLDQNLADLGLPPPRTRAELRDLSWSSLVADIGKLSQYVEVAVHAVFTSERSLCDSIFGTHTKVKPPPALWSSDSVVLTPGLGWRLRDGQLAEISFSNLTLRAVGMIFGLTGEVMFGSRSGHPDQMVRVLEVYEPLLEVEAAILHIFRGHACEQICGQYKALLLDMREKLIDFIAELELFVQKDVTPLPPAVGAVLPCTSYLANLLLALQRQERTLNLLLTRPKEPSPASKLLEDPGEDQRDGSSMRGRGDGDGDGGLDMEASVGVPKDSVFATIVRWNFHVLQRHLEDRSLEYDSVAKQKLFLTSNLHYLANKVKRSDLRDLLGDDWLMELGFTVRDFANAYQRVTWKPFLACLEDEGGGWGGHISLINIKKRFKECSFRFFEIHAAQQHWHVPDLSLRQELRSAMVVRVDVIYRAFYSRYKPIVEVSWNVDKHIKLHPDVVASKIEEFFRVSDGK